MNNTYRGIISKMCPVVHGVKEIVQLRDHLDTDGELANRMILVFAEPPKRRHASD